MPPGSWRAATPGYLLMPPGPTTRPSSRRSLAHVRGVIKPRRPCHLGVYTSLRGRSTCGPPAPAWVRNSDSAGAVVEEEPAQPDFAWLSRHSWEWNPARLDDLIRAAAPATLCLCGGADNQLGAGRSLHPGVPAGDRRGHHAGTAGCAPGQRVGPGGLRPDRRQAADLGFLVGAGEGNRTLMTSLEGWGSTIELRPHRPSHP